MSSPLSHSREFKGRITSPLDMHGARLHVGTTMRTSPGFPKQPPDQTARHTATNHDADTNGSGKFPGGNVRAERRLRPQPSSPEGHLQALPATTLLDRLPIPMLATGLDGVVVYTNPAFATLLGHHRDTITLTGKRLPELLAGHSATSPRDCVTALRNTNKVVVDWFHTEGFPVRSVISETLFVRGTDEILLIGITDITELIWTNPPESH
jgi:PAS domain S-box-containing protein